jgi:hypothetical protein
VDVWTHNTSLALPLVIEVSVPIMKMKLKRWWSTIIQISGNKSGKWAIMYTGLGIHFAYFYNFSIGIGIFSTIWFFGTVFDSALFWNCFRQCAILELFRQCDILELFRPCDILTYLFRQCDILNCFDSVIFWTVSTVWYFGTVFDSVIFWNCFRQCAILELFRQCDILTCFDSVIFWLVSTMWYFDLFRQCDILNCFDSVIFWTVSIVWYFFQFIFW